MIKVLVEGWKWKSVGENKQQKQKGWDFVESDERWKELSEVVSIDKKLNKYINKIQIYGN